MQSWSLFMTVCVSCWSLPSRTRLSSPSLRSLPSLCSALHPLSAAPLIFVRSFPSLMRGSCFRVTWWCSAALIIGCSLLNDYIIYNNHHDIHHQLGSEKSLVVSLVLQELNHLFIGELGTFLRKGCQVLQLLITSRINWSFRLVCVFGKVECLILFPADVVHSAKSLRSPWSLCEIAWVSASTVSAPVLNKETFTLLYDL